jgi:hypothetical protein
MLSSLPKLADKAFILGFFLPTLLFVLAIAALFYDQPWANTVLNAVSQVNAWDKLAYFVLTVWVLSILLMMFNLIEFQILEGYRWPISKISRFKQAEERRFEPRNREFTELDNDWKRLGDDFGIANRWRWAALRMDLMKDFPTGGDELLPTRLGNAIRAFEGYSREVYGADSIPLWLHLSTVLPDGFQSALDDARAQVNCAVNISILAGVVAPIALIALIRFLWLGYWNATNSYHGVVAMFSWVSGAYILGIIAAIAISRSAYLFAIELVYTWGDLVKAAFDCYLPALADKLGYRLPETGEERKAFWQAVSSQSIYWVPLEPEHWRPAEKKPPANADANTFNEIKKLLSAIFR